MSGTLGGDKEYVLVRPFYCGFSICIDTCDLGLYFVLKTREFQRSLFQMVPLLSMAPESVKCGDKARCWPEHSGLR